MRVCSSVMVPHPLPTRGSARRGEPHSSIVAFLNGHHTERHLEAMSADE